ncbi:acyl-CoA dehydrogenase family protein [Geminicoccaceae bacterium 1502E]|nr:acyl-CoA dehydrogenase family protein [Geminicoccaceae bacterium 1502E]
MAMQLAVERSVNAGLLHAAGEALAAADRLLGEATDGLRERLAPGGRLDRERFAREQRAAHGLAWLKAHVEALRAMEDWGRRLAGLGLLGEREALILEWAFGEYLARMTGGLPMSQGEIVRPHDLGLGQEAVARFATPAVQGLVRATADPVRRARLAALLEQGDFGEWGLEDEELVMVRDQFERFSNERVVPYAHDWHRADRLIPGALIDELSALGVFGLTIPEEFGGLGLGKIAMCVVTEELSRGYIGVGSLGTRTEIAAELIRLGGTEEQKRHWLPRLASGETIPTAVFTEPDTGSDLASLSTRAVLEDGMWRVRGAKTWITHAARADLMTLLVRTDPAAAGYRGLSMLLAEKPRGDDGDPFPVEGLGGSEIPVLGYRGMKEYALSFDGFAVPEGSLLGRVPGQGFKQLMATFESARIQTAARAVGVARRALELGLAYARERRQFAQPLFAFPRVHDKLAWMAVEIMVARQLTLFAARAKDADRRCDLEAGLAKLLAAQVAWSAADNALQIHGGNGYALEYEMSRVLCDARVLNIFEGAAEIQAQVVARRILVGGE